MTAYFVQLVLFCAVCFCSKLLGNAIYVQRETSAIVPYGSMSCNYFVFTF